jgi:hypothetical protein
VPDIPETVFFSHHLRPFLNSATFYLDSDTTAFTDEMVVVGFTAQPIDSFTIISPQYINDLVVNKTLQ